MPKTTDRVPGPSRGAFCDCGWETPVIPTSMTPLDQAIHRVHHFEWQLTKASGTIGAFGGADDVVWDVLTAYRMLDTERRGFESRQRARIVDLEEELEAARWDLKVRDEVIDDLKADLAAVEEGRRGTDA